MAYKYWKLPKSFTTSAEAYTDVCDLLTEAGWELYDTFATNVADKVFRSNGENGDQPYVYLRVYHTGTTLQISTTSNWNNTTHTHVGGSVPSNFAIGTGVVYKYYLYASKDLLISNVFSSGAYYTTHMLVFADVSDVPGRFVTTLTAGIAAGSNIVIPVADNTNFIVGCYYGIFDAANGKRQAFKCTAKGTGNITAETINTSLDSGSLIGICPYPLYGKDSSNAFTFDMCHVDPRFAGGTTFINSAYKVIFGRFDVSPGYGCIANLAVASHGSVYEAEPGTARRLLPVPVVPYSSSSPCFAFLGTMPPQVKEAFTNSASYLYGSTMATLNDQDVIGLNQVGTGTSTGNNTATEFNDTAQAWGTNQWAGKVLITTSGAEAGQIVKIISNTGTQLITDGFALIPASCTYTIADEGWRMFRMFNTTFSHGFIREGI